VAAHAPYVIVKDKLPRDAGSLEAAYETLEERLGAPAADRQDGLRLDWPAERRWLHLRASGTEPILRIIAEAPTRGGGARRWSSRRARHSPRRAWRRRPRRRPARLDGRRCRHRAADRRNWRRARRLRRICVRPHDRIERSMCGIVGYIGDRQAVPLLLEGLKRLEYRGYDSAGLTSGQRHAARHAQGGGQDRRAREAGRQRRQPDGTIGIAHTRWATHGAPTERNAHPHSAAGRVRRGAQRHHRERRHAAEEAGGDGPRVPQRDGHGGHRAPHRGGVRRQPGGGRAGGAAAGRGRLRPGHREQPRAAQDRGGAQGQPAAARVTDRRRVLRGQRRGGGAGADAAGHLPRRRRDGRAHAGRLQTLSLGGESLEKEVKQIAWDLDAIEKAATTTS
jgi:hypothetical protein